MMNQRQAEEIAHQMNTMRVGMLALVKVALPDDDSAPSTPEQKAAVRALITEVVAAHVVIAGSVATCAIHLGEIAAQMVKANEPIGLMDT